jgi:hypothetical protein
MKRAALAITVLGCLTFSTFAATPTTRLSESSIGAWWQHQQEGLNRYEFFQMLSAIMTGSQMGPGDGWFHPGQSRYGWKWLAERCQVRDGVITPRDFPGSLSLFQRLDRDGNGALTPDDFDWTERSPFLRQAGMARQWFGRMDKDSNGRISRQEWDSFFERAAKGKDHLTPEDLRLALFGTAPSPLAKKKGVGGPTPQLLIERLLTGELGSPFEGPRVGQRAPDFSLPMHDGKGEVRLSQFLGKPVVLVFGSFT